MSTAKPTATKKAPKPRPTRAKAKAKRSHLELRWIREWERQGGPELVEEFRFHPVRMWRADFAHLASRTLIEIEGGAAGGRHTRKAGFEGDMEKYLTAHLHGWEVVRVGAALVRGDIIAAVIGRLREKCAEASGGGSGKSAEAFESGSLGEDGSGAARVCGCGDFEVCDECQAPDGREVEGVDESGNPAWLSLGAGGLRLDFGEGREAA